MMNEKKVVDTIEEMVDKMIEAGGVPYAIICSKKTFEILAREMRKLDRFRELDNIIPIKMWLKYSFGDLPVLKFKFCPEDKIHVVDKDTYEQIMKQKTITYHQRGLRYDFGKKTIIKRIG